MIRIPSMLGDPRYNSQTAERLLFIMVGLPGCGKSHTVQQIIAANVGINNPEFAVISTDDLIEEYATANNLNYSQAFNQVDFGDILSLFCDRLFDAVLLGKHIIIDQTNTTAKSRNRKIAQVDQLARQQAKDHCRFPFRYTSVAVHVAAGDQTIQQRLDERAARTGKIIPPSVCKQMRDQLTTDTDSDNCDHWFTVYNPD